ncbi:MAG: NADH-quinone oxidoreductase subunit NuoE [Pseudomonadota bacterium]
MSEATTDKVRLSDETRAKIDHWVAKFPPEQKRSAVIQALTAAQDQNGGWLSREIITEVAQYLDIPAAWAYEVASFYSLFHLQPVGRHKVALCTNISCWLRGANDLAAHMERKLGIEMGETTADGRITLVKEEECLAGCVGAPMMIVNGHYHENLDETKVDELLDGLD